MGCASRNESLTDSNFMLVFLMDKCAKSGLDLLPYPKIPSKNLSEFEDHWFPKDNISNSSDSDTIV